MAFVRYRPLPFEGPDFGGSQPPVVMKVSCWGDPDLFRVPTVARLVKRASWPAKSLYPPTQSMVRTANAHLRRIWQGRRSAMSQSPPGAAPSFNEMGQVSNGMGREDFAGEDKTQPVPKAMALHFPGHISQKLEEPSAAIGIPPPLRDAIKKELLAEQAKSAQEKEEADAAAQLKEAYDTKLKQEAGDAAVAAYIAEMDAKKASIATNTLQSYCYHRCGCHAWADDMLFEGKPVKAKEKQQTKSKNDAEAADTKTSKQPQSTTANNSDKGPKSSSGATTSKPNGDQHDAAIKPASEPTPAPAQTPAPVSELPRLPPVRAFPDHAESQPYYMVPMTFTDYEEFRTFLHQRSMNWGGLPRYNAGMMYSDTRPH